MARSTVLYPPSQGTDGKWYVTGPDGGHFGPPFPHRGAATDWMLEHARAAEQQERIQAGAYRAKLRAELLSDQALADGLAIATNTGDVKAARRRMSALLKRYGVRFASKSVSPRGRPVPENPREADIAFEYYWRIRQRGKPSRVVAALAKAYHCTPGHVRKVRKEYAPVASYDDDLLRELQAQAVQRRTQPSSAALPSPPKVSKHERACAWLRALLSDGPMPARKVYERAQMADLSKRTIERAKQSLGILSPRGGSASTWTLPPNPAKRQI